MSPSPNPAPSVGHHWLRDANRRGYVCQYKGLENASHDTCGALNRVGCGAFVGDLEFAEVDWNGSAPEAMAELLFFLRRNK